MKKVFSIVAVFILLVTNVVSAFADEVAGFWKVTTQAKLKVTKLGSSNINGSGSFYLKNDGTFVLYLENSKVISGNYLVKNSKKIKYTAESVLLEQYLTDQFIQEQDVGITNVHFDIKKVKMSTTKIVNNKPRKLKIKTKGVVSCTVDGSEKQVKFRHKLIIFFVEKDDVPVPAANFEADVTKGSAPLAVQLTDSSIGNPTSWSWNFGDDTSSTEQNPEHTYSNPGIYTVTLTVTNEYGEEDSDIKEDYIIVEKIPTSDGWVIEKIDNPVSMDDTSIVVDSTGKTHIVYASHTDNGTLLLNYVTNASGEWVIKPIENSGHFTYEASIAIDSNDGIHVVYTIWSEEGSPFELKYATNASSEWQFETINDNEDDGYNPSIVIDSSDGIHVIYTENFFSKLKYATNTSGSWITETINDNGSTGFDTSIAIDLNDSIHVSYYTDGDEPELLYATNSSGDWIVKTIDNDGWAGFNSSIVVDLNGSVHISYHNQYDQGDQTYANLKYATNVSGDWIIKTIDNSDGYTDFTSITADSNGYIHISYHYSSETESDLKYATNASGGWITETIDNTSDVGYFNSIAVDSNNEIHVSYTGWNTNWSSVELKYATKKP